MIHYHYIDSPDSPHRLVIEMDPAKAPGMPYGAIEWVYDQKSTDEDFVSNRLEEIQPLVRNDLLILQDVFESESIITIQLRAGHVLEDIVLDEVHTLVELVNESGMLYWIMIGRSGAFSLKAKVVKDADDRDSKIAKLRTNLKDIPLREYLGRKARARIGEYEVDNHKEYPPVMDTETAARYLGRSRSWLYGKARDGVIPRTPDKRFRREDLDEYQRREIEAKKKNKKKKRKR
ncbi:helix-turn-helix domain protein [bacterium BMS3Bbin04]|nr:helix-turn-helix domain protein [bacterium BMS3Bbin04]